VSELPELIAENCDDPAVLAFAVESAKLEPDRISAWADVLAASAIKSEVAAKSLSAVSLGLDWNKAVELLRDDARWDRILVLKSALSDVLSLSQSGHQSHPNLRETELLRQFPGPGSLLKEDKRRRQISYITFFFGVIMVMGSLIISSDVVMMSVGDSGSELQVVMKSLENGVGEKRSKVVSGIESVGWVLGGYVAMFVSMLLMGHRMFFEKYLRWGGMRPTTKHLRM
jgi:hypothetical protein